MNWGSKYCGDCVNNRTCYIKAGNFGDLDCPIYQSSIQKIFEKEYNKVNGKEGE